MENLELMIVIRNKRRLSSNMVIRVDDALIWLVFDHPSGATCCSSLSHHHVNKALVIIWSEPAIAVGSGVGRRTFAVP